MIIFLVLRVNLLPSMGPHPQTLNKFKLKPNGAWDKNDFFWFVLSSRFGQKKMDSENIIIINSYWYVRDCNLFINISYW